MKMRKIYSSKAVIAILFVFCMAFGTTLKAANKVQVEVKDKSGWSVKKYSSSQSGDGNVNNVVDGNSTTYWHTAYSPQADFPHWILIDMGQEYDVTAFTYLIRNSNTDRGRIKDYDLYFAQETTLQNFDWNGYDWDANKDSKDKGIIWDVALENQLFDDGLVSQVTRVLPMTGIVTARYFLLNVRSTHPIGGSTPTPYIAVAELGVKVEIENPVYETKKYYIRNQYTGMYLKAVKDNLPIDDTQGHIIVDCLEFGNPDFEFQFTPKSIENLQYLLKVNEDYAALYSGWKVVLKDNSDDATYITLKDVASLSANSIYTRMSFETKTEVISTDVNSKYLNIYGDKKSSESTYSKQSEWVLEEVSTVVAPLLPKSGEAYKIRNKATGLFLTYQDGANETVLRGRAELTEDDKARQIFKFTKTSNAIVPTFYLQETFSNKYIVEGDKYWELITKEDVSDETPKSQFIVSPNSSGVKLRTYHKNKEGGNKDQIHYHLGLDNNSASDGIGLYVNKDASNNYQTDWEFIFVDATPTNINMEASLNNIFASVKDGIINISSSSAIKDVAIYNLQGVLVYANNNISKDNVEIAIGNMSNVYIIKVVTLNGVENIKLNIK